MDKHLVYFTNIFALLCTSIILFFEISCLKEDGELHVRSANYSARKFTNKLEKGKVVEIVDLAGRTVTVPTGDVKVVLGNSLMVYAIAPLFGKNGNPFKHIVGWNNAIEYDPDTYEKYLEKFPEISKIPDLGQLHKGTFSIEKVISLNADIVFINLHHFKASKEIGLVEKLEKIGVKTVFLDFGKYPQRYVIPSMLLIGQIFQKTAAALNFINFSFIEMEKVYSVIDKIEEDTKPLVLLESAPNGGWSKVGEYMLFGSHWIGRLVEIAGGRNYGSEVFGDKWAATISMEQLFAIDPDVIIGTGGNWHKLKSDTKAVSLGYKANKKNIQEGINSVVSRVGWQTLRAVKNKNVHLIFHAFSYYPAYFVPVQQIAKWLYPEKFVNLDPEKIFKEFHEKFLPIEYSGVFWESLE